MNYSRFLRQVIPFVLVFALAGCANQPSPALPTAAVPTETVQAAPTSTPRPVIPVSPTPVPSEHQGNDELAYCVGIPGPARILLSDLHGLSEDEIAEKMLRARLDYFSNPKAPDYCRIEKYRIDKISKPEPWMLDNVSLPARSILRVVNFSVKMHQLSEYWFRFVTTEIDLPNGYTGDLKDQNWLKTSIILVVYEMNFDGPNDFYEAAQIRIYP
jgi:hypothetical protein